MAAGARPEGWWDRFFLGMADYVATASKDPSTKVGAVIVRPDRTVASVGFNGFARGVLDTPERYADREYKIATILHAEENAILSAHEPVRGHTLYVSGLPPCAMCAAKIAQAGIARVVAHDRPVPDRWRTNMGWGAQLLAEAGVALCCESVP